jgi:hypothetical protein
MLTKETGRAISKIKDPYGRLTVIAVIVLSGAIVAMFWIMRDDRSEKLNDNLIEITQLKIDLTTERLKTDSLKGMVQDLKVDTAMLRAKFIIELYNQNQNFGKILDSIKNKLQTK